MNVAIIGCGLIGKKRALTLKEHKLVAAADINLQRARAVAAVDDRAIATTDWREAILRGDVDLVIVATTNDLLTPVSLAAARAGKHVLVEKPAARNSKEIEELITAAEESRIKVKVGFNLRYHPALQKAKEIVDSGVLGPLMFVRGRYGHGGRIGYDREWRANKEISGGGQLLDQGVHLIDLSRWFLGDFEMVKGFVHTYFWDMPVDDNSFLFLKTTKQQVAWLHTSCTEWKNLFSFEIYGIHGKLHVEGLGGSYGVERLAYYKMLPEMGPPETIVWEYPGEDKSWQAELNAFLEVIEWDQPLCGDLSDALAALKIVDQIYGVNLS